MSKEISSEMEADALNFWYVKAQELEAENKNLKKMVAKCNCLTCEEYRDWNKEAQK